MDGARGELEALGGAAQQARRRRPHGAVDVHFRRVQGGIALAGAVHLPRPSARHGLVQGRVVARARVHGPQILFGHRADLHADVDAVQERAGEAALVLPDLGRRAAAARFVADIAGRTRIHRRHELKARRIAHRLVDPRHRDFALFERFAQRFQGVALELRQFVQEQDAAMRQRHFARRNRRATADDGRRRGGVVGVAERP